MDYEWELRACKEIVMIHLRVLFQKDLEIP
jgi:hypothetical protein